MNTWLKWLKEEDDFLDFDWKVKLLIEPVTDANCSPTKK